MNHKETVKMGPLKNGTAWKDRATIRLMFRKSSTVFPGRTNNSEDGPEKLISPALPVLFWVHRRDSQTYYWPSAQEILSSQ
jgi:hypothetical protein